MPAATADILLTTGADTIAVQPRQDVPDMIRRITPQHRICCFVGPVTRLIAASSAHCESIAYAIL